MYKIKELKENLGDARKKKHDLKNKRRSLLRKMENLADKPNFSNSDQQEFNRLKNKIETITPKIEKFNQEINDLTDRVIRMGEDPNWHLNNEDPSSFLPGNSGGFSGGSKNVEIWESISGENKGQEVKVLNNKASLAQELDVQSPEGLNWHNYIRQRIAGYTGNNGIQTPVNTMSTTSDSALVPEPLSTSVIDLARNKSRIFQAGALTVPMDSKTLTIARVTGDPTPAWKAENASYSSSDATVDGVVFTAKTLIANVKISVELGEDAPNGSNVVQNSIAEQLALELDRAALVGSGTDPEPQGIFGATNVQTEDMGTDGAALTNYDPYSNAYQKVLEANGEPNSVIHAPRTWGALDRLKDSTNQPLVPPQSFQNLQKFQTNQIPIDMTKGTATNASIAILGAYSNLMIGLRTNIRLEVTRIASDSVNSAWEDLQIWVRAYLRADVQLAHPDHFCIIEGITP